MTPHLLTLAGNPELQDRVQTFSDANRLIIALADGAGGISGGAQAAEAFIRIVAEQKSSLFGPADSARLMREADQRISDDPTAGETTGIVLVIEQNQIFGASVGDSEAWIFSSGEADSLTKNQRRKPFLGSGRTNPATFTLTAPQGVLLIATDGLWKYTSHEKIAAQIQLDNISTLPDRLANLVRLRSGALQDDIALAVISLN